MKYVIFKMTNPYAITESKMENILLPPSFGVVQTEENGEAIGMKVFDTIEEAEEEVVCSRQKDELAIDTFRTP